MSEETETPAAEPLPPLSMSDLAKEGAAAGVPSDLVEHLLNRCQTDDEVRDGFDQYLAGEFRSSCGTAVWVKPKPAGGGSA